MILPSSSYSDLPMFLEKNSFTGDISLKKGLTAIRNSIKNIILTSVGERPFDSNFGGSLYSLLFEPLLNDISSLPIKLLLVNNIHQYEPRASVDEITISSSDNTMVDIIIQYSINQLNTTDTLTISLERTR